MDCDHCGIEQATDSLTLSDGTVINLCDQCYWTVYHTDDDE